jgi:hypothetical protein
LRETRAIGPSAAPKRIAPLALFSVDCELQYVVDLMKNETLRALRVTADELTDDWRAIVLQGKTPATHDLVPLPVPLASKGSSIHPHVCPELQISPSLWIGCAGIADFASIRPMDLVPRLQLRSLGSGNGEHRLASNHSARRCHADGVAHDSRAP